MNENKLFHLNIPADFNAEYAILPGDPARVDLIAEELNNPELIGEKREFRSVAGMLNGKKVIITSTGIGGPSAAIALEELYISGVRTAIRTGTCGGMQIDVVPGDLIIPTAAVRMEGTSKEYAPIEFPAAADFDIVKAIVKAAQKLEYRYHTGIIQSKDSFYGQHNPSGMPVGEMLSYKWEAWKKLGVLASEMETAALFTVSHVRGIKTGCVLHALWNQERKKSGFTDDDKYELKASISTAVEALKIIIGERNE